MGKDNVGMNYEERFSPSSLRKSSSSEQTRNKGEIQWSVQYSRAYSRVGCCVRYIGTSLHLEGKT